MRELQCSATQFKSFHDRRLVLIWTEGYQIFRGEMPDIDLLPETKDDILDKAVGTLIPNDHLFPPWSDTITEAKQPLSPNVFVKMHYSDLLSYDGKPEHKLFTEEVKVLEILSKRPHPNVNKYLGCIRNGDAIGGICLEKHDCTLAELVNGKVPADRAPPFQPDVIIAGITAGLEHVHSFGLVHCDINPRNIVVDKSGNAIIIDFDSCVPVGAKCGPGTPGWAQIDWSSPAKIAAFENDAYGLDLVAKFVRGEYDGKDVDLGFDDEPQNSPKPQETEVEPLTIPNEDESELQKAAIRDERDRSPLSSPQASFELATSTPALHGIDDAACAPTQPRPDS